MRICRSWRPENRDELRHALGDVTNIAARLTARAQPGEILMDSATYEAVNRLYLKVERRELKLKGKSAPVEAFAIPAR